MDDDEGVRPEVRQRRRNGRLVPGGHPHRRGGSKYETFVNPLNKNRAEGYSGARSFGHLFSRNYGKFALNNEKWGRVSAIGML